MNAEQLRLFLRGAFADNATAAKIMKQLRPALADTLARVRLQVERLPTESLSRQLEWRKILRDIELELAPLNDRFWEALQDELPPRGDAFKEEVTKQIRAVGIRDVASLAGPVEPSVAMQDSVKWLLNTKVGDRRIVDLFDRTDGTSPFTAANRRLIDQIVTGGIIEGKSTAEIAKKIYPELSPGIRYIGTDGAKRMMQQAQAIAITAIQDYNSQVREQVYEDNEEALSDLWWEYIATLDSRTCLVCGQHDGKLSPKRSDLPKKEKQHIRCRCQIMQVDPDDDVRQRFGRLVSEKPTKGKDGGFVSKAKVNGEKLYQRDTLVNAKDGKTVSYAEWLADLAKSGKGMTADQFRKSAKTHLRDLPDDVLTLRHAIGSNKKTEQFLRLLESGKSPDKALEDLVK